MTVNRLASEIGDWPLFEPPSVVLSIAGSGAQLGAWPPLSYAWELGNSDCDWITVAVDELGFIGCVSGDHDDDAPPRCNMSGRGRPHAHESRPLFLSFNARTRDESEGRRRNAILKGEIRDAKKATEDGDECNIFKKCQAYCRQSFFDRLQQGHSKHVIVGKMTRELCDGREFSLKMLSLEIDAADESLVAPIVVGDNALLGQLRPRRPTARHLSLASGETLSQPFKFSARTR